MRTREEQILEMALLYDEVYPTRARKAALDWATKQVQEAEERIRALLQTKNAQLWAYYDAIEDMLSHGRMSIATDRLDQLCRARAAVKGQGE